MCIRDRASTETVGRTYEMLFQRADQALYAGKRDGRGRYYFYDDSMKEMFSVISSIDLSLIHISYG